MEIFNFDYAVISLFDFRLRKISSKKDRSFVTSKKELGQCHPDLWVELSTYHENDNDILLKVLQQRKKVTVVGKYIFDENVRDGASTGEKIDFNAINRHLFEKYEHSKLARFYMPIIYRALRDDDESVDLPIGVIEIGIKERLDGQFSVNNEQDAYSALIDTIKDTYPSLQLLEQLLQLYTDNFAQPCFAAMVEEEGRVLLEMLKNLREENNNYAGLSYETYAADVIEKVTGWLGIDYGVIALKTFNNNYINYLDKGTYFSDNRIRGFLNLEVFGQKNDLFEQKSILVHVTEEKFSTYYSDNTSAMDGKYVDGINFPDPPKSEMISPIYYGNEIMGVIDLYSCRPAYFNPLMVALVERLMKIFISSYMVKKRQHVYTNLVKPAEAWNSPREVYHQLVKLLTDYYYTGTVCLWTKNVASSENEYNLEEGFEENRDFVEDVAAEMSRTKILSNAFTRKPGAEIDLHYDFAADNSINRFCKKNDFKFYLSLSIKVINKYDLFINIFSRLDIFKGSDDREKSKRRFLARDFEFLTQVSTKVSISLLNLRLAQALKDMSAATTQVTISDHEIILQKILQSAQVASGADIVVLFPFYAELKDIRKKHAIMSNGFRVDSEQKAVFADLIFKIRSTEKNPIYNFDSNEECKQFVVENDPDIDLSNFDKHGFRTQNNISSTAAVRLEFGSIPVGVMFFNYKEQQNLRENKSLRQIILFFSIFSAYQLYVSRELDYISRQNKELDKKYLLKAEELERALPLITRTQFYLIVEGASHIIKNALDNIKADINYIARVVGDKNNVLAEREKSIQSSLDLTESVLTIFNFRDDPSKYKKELVNINKIVNATIGFFKLRFGNIQFQSRLHPAIPGLLFYKAEFAMIIYNLVFNAITAIQQAKRKEGLITISVSLSEDEDIYVITVEDNGVGIRHEDDESIYEPGITSKENGTGLGLYYIKTTLENYKGNISHSSVVDSGSVFTITIPLSINYID